MVDPYTENNKTLIKEIEEDTNKWKDILHGLEELILLKCPYYPKKPTWFSAIPIKILMAFFIHIEEITLKCV